jgi:hypothetical protein
MFAQCKSETAFCLRSIRERNRITHAKLRGEDHSRFFFGLKANAIVSEGEAGSCSVPFEVGPKALAVLSCQAKMRYLLRHANPTEKSFFACRHRI